MQLLDMAKIQKEYEDSKGLREYMKYAFSILTFGLGAIYLWLTTDIIQQGEIGLRRNSRGKMILLPPGRHSNFPWETYPIEPQSISMSQDSRKLGPYTIISVQTGNVAKTFNQGKLEVLSEGQYLLKDATHVFDSFVAVKQETKKLEKVTVFTSDNVGLTLHADVRYQIDNPEIAISQIDNIDNSIKEIAVISISQIVSHHTLADFAPATSLGDAKKHGMTDVIHELTKQITAQLSELGIKLLNIGVTSWSINDKDLAHELAQGAVIQSQVRSKVLSAKQEAEVLSISTEAQARRTIALAESDASATKLRGEAINAVATGLESDAARDIYLMSQQVELVKGSSNPNLFFSQQLGALPQLTVPVPIGR